jgi:hypothetical protein
MEQANKEHGIIIAVLEQLEKKTLPDALWIKDKVDKGGLLSEGDIEFLERVLEETTAVKPLINSHPEWQSLYASAISLYKYIISKALENQQALEASKSP